MADNQGGGSSDTAVGLFWIGLVLAALAWLFWRFQGDLIFSAFRYIRYSEIWLISLVLGSDHIINWRGNEIPLGEIMDVAESMPAYEITSDFLGLMSTAAMTPIRWVIVGILAILTLWAYLKGPESENRIRFSIDTLLKRQSTNFPVIQPFVRFNPAKLPPRPPGSPVPANIPLFAEALGPEEWLAFNGVNPDSEGKMSESVLTKAFAKQLGPRWQGAKRLAPYKQIMLASFCLKAARKRNEADAMLGRLAQCWSHDKGLNLKKDKKLLPQARKILANKDISQATLALCNQHAWQTTALMRALFHARSEGGVLAPAQFVWLRGYDRTLWYPMNNLGRNSFHLEALGAMCHYKAEKLSLRPIPKPKLKDAVDSITEYMNSDKARPIPQIDYTGSKERGVKKMKTA